MKKKDGIRLDPTKELDHEICQIILSMLPSTLDISRAGMVSKTWNTLANSPLVWQGLDGLGGVGVLHESKLDSLLVEKKEEMGPKETWIRILKIWNDKIVTSCFSSKAVVRVWNEHESTLKIQLGIGGRCIDIWKDLVWVDNTDDDGTALIVAFNSKGKEVKRINVDSPSFYLLANGDSLLSGHEDGTIKAWDYEGNIKYTCQRSGHRERIMCLKFWQGRMYSASQDKSIAVWYNQYLIERCIGHTGPVRSLEVYNGHLFSASYDGTIKCWNNKHEIIMDIVIAGRPRICNIIHWQGLLFSCGDMEDIVAYTHMGKEAKRVSIEREDTGLFIGLTVWNGKLWTCGKDGILTSFSARFVAGGCGEEDK